MKHIFTLGALLFFGPIAVLVVWLLYMLFREVPIQAATAAAMALGLCLMVYAAGSEE